jgi:sarcosine oxidase, subunit delta
MKLVPCPLNGLRPMEEFVYGGELRRAPAPLPDDDAAWARHVYDRQGVPATRREWWYHQPSGFWFIAMRDTLSGEFLETYSATQLRETSP